MLTIPAEDNWSTVSTLVESSENIALLRMFLEGKGETPVKVRSIRLREANGNVREFDFSP